MFKGEPSKNRLGLNSFLFRWHKAHNPALGFQAKTKKTALDWQRAFEKALIKAMGPVPECGSLKVRRGGVKKVKGGRLERLYLRASPWHKVPLNLLVPEGAKKAPVILALHGHGEGKTAVINEKSPSYRGFALEYMRRGYLVATPDFYSFGERVQKDHAGAGMDILCNPKIHPEINPYSVQDHVCNAGFVTAMLYGFTPLALNVFDVRSTLDYLETRPEADVNRTGCIGVSYGGTTTMYTTALDKRIKRAVLSCSFGAFAGHGLYLDELCGVQVVPGILRLGDMAEVAGCIAPRPLLLEVAKNDIYYPWIHTESELKRLKSIYAVMGVKNLLKVDVQNDGHRFYGTYALDWFNDL
jgi:dienelactone hydrolase